MFRPLFHEGQKNEPASATRYWLFWWDERLAPNCMGSITGFNPCVQNSVRIAKPIMGDSPFLYFIYLGFHEVVGLDFQILFEVEGVRFFHGFC